MSSKQIQMSAQTQTEVTPKEQELTAKLYTALRQLRTRLTDSAGDGVMPYHLFTNATLLDISTKIPRSKEDLLRCSGIGNAKLIKYGDHILETIESTICKYYDVERQNTSNGDENKSIQSADTIFGAQLLTELAKSCKKKSDVAKAKRQSTPLVESRHEADQGETVVAASRQGRKRKNTELEKSPNFNNSAEERAEELSSGPISVPSCAETCSPFLVSFPPASEAPDIMSRMCPPEATTALRHLSNEQMRIEATRSFALTSCHVGNLLASHEALEDTNSRQKALIDELSRENKELSKSTGELKGEIEKLKSAVMEKEERELKLKDAEGDELEHVHEPEPAAELEMEVEPGPFVYLPMIEPEPFVDLPLIMDVDPPIPDVASTSTPPPEFSWDEMFVRFAAFELHQEAAQEATLVRLQALQAEITREIREQLDATEVYITEQYFGEGRENLEKAGLSLPRSVGHDKSSGMKSDFLLEKARKKKAGGSKQYAKKIAGDNTSKQDTTPTLIDMPIMPETALSLLPGGSVEGGVQGEKGVDPPQSDRGKKRPRPASRVDPVAGTALARFTSVAPVPSIDDMKSLAPPDKVCVKEREWLTSLSSRDLQLECMKYAEMTRLSMLASTTYSNNLETKCRKIREKCEAELSKMNAAVVKLEKEKANLVEKDAKISDENARLMEENKLVKTSVENLQQAIAAKDSKVTELEKERDDWRFRAERAVPDYIKSEDYSRSVVDELLPHWELGIRVGVRQAVAKYNEIDPRILYFEPDYEDLCGEPPIEDE